MALGGSIPRRYARALLESGIASGQVEALGRDLSQVADLFTGSTELREALENPIFRDDDKQRIMDAVLARVGAAQVLKNFFRLLVQRRRIAFLPAIARAFQAMADTHAGQVRAAVIAAAPLSPIEVERIRASLERRVGLKVLIETSVDPSLIGGVVAHVGDLVLDGSVRTRLEELRSKLLN